jgi:hypothetical protein
LADTGSEKKRETLEEEERIKFSLIIAEWIQEAHLPVVLQILETANSAETWKRLCGSRRANGPPFIQAVPIATAHAAWSTAAGSRIASLQSIP